MTVREYPTGENYEEPRRILLILNILMNVSESEGVFDLGEFSIGNIVSLGWFSNREGGNLVCSSDARRAKRSKPDDFSNRPSLMRWSVLRNRDGEALHIIFGKKSSEKFLKNSGKDFCKIFKKDFLKKI